MKKILALLLVLAMALALVAGSVNRSLIVPYRWPRVD